MNLKGKFYKSPSFLIPIILSAIILGFGVGLIFLKTDNDVYSNVIANSISLMTLVVTGTSIYFLYKTLDAQNEQLKSHQEQIDKNRRDVEFNRAIDIISGLIEKTEKKNENRIEMFIEKAKQALTSIEDDDFDTYMEKISHADYKKNLRNAVNQLNHFGFFIKRIFYPYARIVLQEDFQEREIYTLTSILLESNFYEWLSTYCTLHYIIESSIEEYEYEINGDKTIVLRKRTQEWLDESRNYNILFKKILNNDGAILESQKEEIINFLKP